MEAGPAPKPLAPAAPVTPVTADTSIPVPQPMPYTALTDDTVLDVLPDMPDETPAEAAAIPAAAPAQPSEPDDAENAENEPRALSALPDAAVPEQTTLAPPPQKRAAASCRRGVQDLIITERGGELCLIDKHAAHERILFEQLARDYGNVPSQMLLVPVQVNLTAAEKQAVLQNLDLLTDAGIEAEDFGGSTVVVRAVPADVAVDDVEDMLVELAAKLADGGRDAPCGKRPSGCCIPSPAVPPSRRGTAPTLPRCWRWPSTSWTERSRRSAPMGGPVC